MSRVEASMFICSNKVTVTSAKHRGVRSPKWNKYATDHNNGLVALVNNQLVCHPQLRFLKERSLIYQIIFRLISIREASLLKFR